MELTPSKITYGIDDKPPLHIVILLAIQHIFMMSTTLALPIIMVTAIGGSFEQVRTVTGFTMIACGLGTIIQALRCAYVGSGYLCPNVCGPNFFAVSMQAAWLGGIPLLRGMTIIAGLVEIVFAISLNRLRLLFPPEIGGLVVLMVAVNLIPTAVSKFMGIDYEGDPIQQKNFIIAITTLALMVGLNVAGRGQLKLQSVLIGVLYGYSISYMMGLIMHTDTDKILHAEWLAFPNMSEITHISFQWSLVPAFAIASICGSLKTFGNLTLCQMVNDENWKEPNIRKISNGLVADALTVIISGLLGGMASDTSASNVALSKATGATSRIIAYACGGLFIFSGLSPKLTGILSIMPSPVMGALLVYFCSAMIVAALQGIFTIKLATGKSYAIGLSLFFGLSLAILPNLFINVPGWMHPLFSSSLTLTTVLAVILNQFFRVQQKH